MYPSSPTAVISRWRIANFGGSLEALPATRSQFRDSHLIARWLSNGATVHLMNTTVAHVQHEGRQQDPASWNPQPSFSVVEIDGVKRLKSSWDDASST